MKKIVYLLLIISLNSQPVRAQDNQPKSFWDQCKARLFQIWYQGKTDLYVTNYAWHNRYTYSHEKLSTYNELPWGGGIGKGLWDEHGNWHGLYAITFLDSHKNVQPMGGYGHLWVLHPSENTGIGLGFTLMVTARPDILHNAPFPGALPLLSLHYKQLMIIGAYVPGSENIGNVLFVMTKITFN